MTQTLHRCAHQCCRLSCSSLYERSRSPAKVFLPLLTPTLASHVSPPTSDIQYWLIQHSWTPTVLDFQLTFVKMPIPSCPIPIPSSGDDVWHRNKARIKSLYQDQGETLEEVKRLMEEDGFPKAP